MLQVRTNESRVRHCRIERHESPETLGIHRTVRVTGDDLFHNAAISVFLFLVWDTMSQEDRLSLEFIYPTSQKGLLGQM